VRPRTILAAAAVVCAALAGGQALLPLATASAAAGLTAAVHPTAAARQAFHGRPQRPPATPPTGAVAPTTTPGTPPTSPAAPPPATAVVNPNCSLVVPPAPLTAAGLATPYQLVATSGAAGACHEADPNQSAFVEAAILNPATGGVSIYDPLVVDQGTQPAVPTVKPTLPARAVVGIWFGYQGDTLTLKTNHNRRGNLNLRFHAGDPCVNGSPGSPFTQFAYCNAPAFFSAANAAVRAGKLVVPPLGTGNDGRPCPTTRDFAVVDQDQSDNLPTQYLALANGQTAQFSTANAAQLAGSTTLFNASDNGLLDHLLDPALGCAPFMAPNISAGGAMSSALPLNELQAAADQAAPSALVPLNDPMTMIGTANSTAKTNLYRVGVDQLPVGTGTGTDNGSGTTYCTNLGNIAPARLALDEPFTINVPSPDPAAATSLFGFLTQRLTASWTNLGCQTLTGNAAPVVADAGTTAAAPTTAPAVTPPTDAAAPVAPLVAPAPVTPAPATPAPVMPAPVTPAPAVPTPMLTTAATTP
jgi:hypothetical protein